MASRRSAARLGSQLLCFCNRHSTRCSGLPLSSCIVLLEPARRCIAHGSVLIIEQHRKVSWNEAQCWLCAGQSSHHEALCCLRPSAAGHVTGGLLRQLHVLARQQPHLGVRALLPLGPRQLIVQRGFADLPAHTEMQMPSLSPTMSQVTPASGRRCLLGRLSCCAHGGTVASGRCSALLCS